MKHQHNQLHKLIMRTGKKKSDVSYSCSKVHLSYLRTDADLSLLAKRGWSPRAVRFINSPRAKRIIMITRQSSLIFHYDILSGLAHKSTTDYLTKTNFEKILRSLFLAKWVYSLIARGPSELKTRSSHLYLYISGGVCHDVIQWFEVTAHFCF